MSVRPTAQLNLAAADTSLLPGAQNAIGTCLAVQAGERVVLIFDQESRQVAESLAAALEERGARWQPHLLEDYAPRPVTYAPQTILDALERADVGILCMQPQPGELAARMAIVDIVERQHIRYAHMVGVTPDIMRQGMRADYGLIDRLSERLRRRMLNSKHLVVKTAAGTAFTARFGPDLAWVKTSGLISPQYWSNLPAGEVFTTPVTVDGTFVCDGTAGDYFCAKYGDLSPNPLVLEIKHSRLVSAHSTLRTLENEFWAYCHTDANSDRVGELAFGTNIALSELIGVLLQDEKFPGVHLAFGDPYGRQTHAAWSSTTHVDVLTRNCDVWIDDQQVIAGGQYLFGSLGMSAA